MLREGDSGREPTFEIACPRKGLGDSPWWTHLAPPAKPVRERNATTKHPLLTEQELSRDGTVMRPNLFGPANDAGER